MESLFGDELCGVLSQFVSSANMAPPPERMATLVVLAASHLAALCVSPSAHALHFDENTNTIFPSTSDGHLRRGRNDVQVFYQTGVSRSLVILIVSRFQLWILNI